MKGFIAGVLVTLVALAAAGSALIMGGRVDVSADTPHSDTVYQLIETTRDRAIERAAAGLEVPGNLNDAERIRRGSGNYDAMCASCHLVPGQSDSEIRKGLYPQPPDLTQASDAAGDRAARHFWVIKHGIKASGMPAWSKGGIEDDAIWDMVAFMQKMPTLSPDEYRALVASSDGHSHGGLDDHAHDEPASPSKKKPRHDPHDGHTH